MGEILSTFVSKNGGAAAMARGGGSGGGGVGTGHAARAVAGRLGGFVADVGSVGLAEALQRAGLGELVGRPVGEVLNGLLDYLGGSSNTLDDVDARAALSKVRDELLRDAETAEEVEAILAAQATDLGSLLQQFCGFYLFELFCRVFFERLVQRVGETRAYSFLTDIEAFIRSALANRTFGKDLATLDWSGSAGQSLITELMETTLQVFGS